MAWLAGDPNVTKPPKVRLRKTESPTTGLRRAWETRVSYVSRLAVNRACDLEEEVHLLRLTIKRLRAYLELMRPNLDEAIYVEQDRVLRDIGRSLAGSRDFAVALRTLGCLERSSGDKEERKALASARNAIVKSSAAADDGMAGDEQAVVRAIRDAVAMLERNQKTISELKLDAPGWEVIKSGLYDTYRSAWKAYHRWVESEDPEIGHECRKFSKYLMFQSDLIAPANPRSILRMRRRLSTLQDGLGMIHDLVILEARIREEQEAGNLPRRICKRARRRIHHDIKDLTRAVQKKGKKLFRRSPESLIKRMGADWRLWRNGNH